MREKTVNIQLVQRCFKKWEIVKVAANCKKHVIFKLTYGDHISHYSVYPVREFKYKFLNWVWFQSLKLRVFINLIK